MGGHRARAFDGRLVAKVAGEASGVTVSGPGFDAQERRSGARPERPMAKVLPPAREETVGTVGCQTVAASRIEEAQGLALEKDGDSGRRRSSREGRVAARRARPPR